MVPAGVAITPDGTRAYVTNSGGDAVSVIDTSSNAVDVDHSVHDGLTGTGEGLVPGR